MPLDFDNNQRCEIDSNITFGTGGKFTLAFWCNPDNYDDGRDQRIFASTDSTSTAEHRFAIIVNNGDNNLEWRMSAEGDYHSGDSGEMASFFSNDNQHVVITYDKDEGSNNHLKFYRNGSYFGQDTYAGGTEAGIENTEDVPCWIGSCPIGGSSRYFRGKIENVQMWDRVLSLAEIQTLYYDPSTAILDGMTQWWPLNEKTSGEATTGQNLIKGGESWIASNDASTDASYSETTLRL